MTTTCKKHSYSGLFFGLVLVAAGILFLGLDFGYINPQLKWIIFSWQSLLMLIGLWATFKKHFFFGFSFIAIGGFLLMPKIIEIYPDCFPHFTGDFHSLYFPVILIIIGISIILHIIFRPSLSRKKPNYHHFAKWEKKNSTSGEQSVNGKFSRSSIFSNNDYVVNDDVFSEGTLEVIFGSICLDLRKTTLAEGIASLNISAVFGGITIVVPDDWQIDFHLDSVFGGIQDIRANTAERNETKKLVINGSCVFAGVEIKN